MSRTLHIKRPHSNDEPSEISLEEWKTVVTATDDLRLAQGDASQTNPLTHEVVILPNRGGDAEIWREDCDDWLRVFWYSPEGFISFPAPDSTAPQERRRLSLARSLALKLDAKIYDDDGAETD